ncbi:MAG: phosphate acetyltransferase [Bacteroidales bacterium]|jgi:phosphate acetyltransferase|nr:phosphate acetyltransferase [Bacteroidales bacterium]
MTLLEQIRANAKAANKCIVLAEGTEERTLKAADIILGEGIARLILLGNEAEIKGLASQWGLKNIDKAQIIDPVTNPRKEYFAEMLCEIRKSKGLQMDEAMRLVQDPLYLACMLIKNGDADGEVAGARNATGDVLRPAFQIVKTLPGISVVSGAFIMILKDKTYGENGMFVFADCAATPCPKAEELGQIAVVSAQTAKAIAGFEEPRVAILSFSTKGSAKHELVDKVIAATKVAHELDPSVKLDGELQADAAIVPKVGASKAPNSDIAGRANVLVFPDLQSGNICYKLVQRLAGAEAVGPVMQGMAAPINDLSRGCSVEDVVNVVAITATQAAAKK